MVDVLDNIKKQEYNIKIKILHTISTSSMFFITYWITIIISYKFVKTKQSYNIMLNFCKYKILSFI